MGSFSGSLLKNLPANQEMWVRSLGSGRSPGEENGNPFQYSCLANPMAEAPGVQRSSTRLSD